MSKTIRPLQGGIKEKQIDTKTEKISDMQQIVASGAMITSTLIINDKQYFQKKIPTRHTLTEVPILQYLLTSGIG